MPSALTIHTIDMHTGGEPTRIIVEGWPALTAPTLLGIEVTKRRGATMVVQAEGNQEFPSFPIGRLTRKAVTLKSARGHSYRAVELALRDGGGDDPAARRAGDLLRIVEAGYESARTGETVWLPPPSTADA